MTSFYDLKSLNKELHASEELIFFFRATYYLKNQERIELNDFQRAHEIMKSCLKSSPDSNSGPKATHIVSTFKEIAEIILPHLKKIRLFYKFLNKKMLIHVPELFDRHFVRQCESLEYIEDIQTSLTAINEHLFLSELGFELKEYFKNFRKIEFELTKIANENTENIE